MLILLLKMFWGNYMFDTNFSGEITRLVKESFYNLDKKIYILF